MISFGYEFFSSDTQNVMCFVIVHNNFSTGLPVMSGFSEFRLVG